MDQRVGMPFTFTFKILEIVVKYYISAVIFVHFWILYRNNSIVQIY